VDCTIPWLMELHIPPFLNVTKGHYSQRPIKLEVTSRAFLRQVFMAQWECHPVTAWHQQRLTLSPVSSLGCWESDHAKIVLY
jgi:hypothetical protein